ncbi:hypothetical protein H310_12266 [Aphanomyces invadans]|uniref:Uncharacterized protein n=1 Tax=Aphanomyces invadans TaxID=157072 RepID=A0A024TIR8_9STRA|nr:hypothetical protein H310_12266 [Aphanomyces invadans]ETV93923.1 hypothetical protein H310_12266 [Aphanomyces invadans]|eukprot:XP_008877483.1 hypothetical protein H310_12266 [Aphanomyces invadans]
MVTADDARLEVTPKARVQFNLMTDAGNIALMDDGGEYLENLENGVDSAPAELPDPTDLVLQACAVPKGNSMDETLRMNEAKEYMVKQFGMIQEQVGMNPNTLQFDSYIPSSDPPEKFEVGYLKWAQEASMNRIRLCFAVGFVFLAAYLAYEVHNDLFTVRTGIPRSHPASAIHSTVSTLLYIVTFGCGCGAFAVGYILVHQPWAAKHLETITFWVFAVVALSMIFKKPLQQQAGPVLPLVILIIPIFGITRMRFIHSCVLGWSIFFVYLVVQLVSLNFIDDIPSVWKYDNVSDIIYQTINYGIGIIGGMVSHYRQELTRRRNYALKLPFAGPALDDEPVDFSADTYSEEKLLDPWTLAFRNLAIEEYFCKVWYLIDPHPYENPNRGDIHENVYWTIRYAVLGVGLSQIVLGIQDIKLLLMKHFYFEYGMAAVIRFAIVVPCYLGAFYFLYLLGKKYWSVFLRRGMSKLDLDAAVAQDKRSRIKTKWVESKGGYVRSAQVFSIAVVAIHVCSMMILLLQVGYAFMHNYKDKQPKPTKPNVYFMGLLNAILYAHRSGFKLRFVYAFRSTSVLIVLFIFFASHNLHWDPWEYLWLEYTGFLICTQLLGMMISHEEEALRRNFFILKSIRIVEFEKWFAGVLVIQKRVRRFLKRHKSRKQLLQHTPPGDTSAKPTAIKPVAHAQAFLARASLLGCRAQMIQIAIVLFDVIYSAATA